MWSRACGRLSSGLRGGGASSAVVGRRGGASGPRASADPGEGAAAAAASGPLQPALLEFLVCPLSKKPLRYDASTNELVNEELGIAYPIVDGIPNMIPQAARSTLQAGKQEEAPPPPPQR
uniref:protein preY, mitochondrial n=1 Tax=Jaculus jaculus TaxID=51337 RepID=UPI001E1B2BC2|nr:protein preY, mitochondrial [Jaculus jaculus]